MAKLKSFTCGRGIHKVYIFKGLLPIEQGYITITKSRGSTENSCSMRLEKLSMLGRVFSFIDYLDHKNSIYFRDSSSMISSTYEI
jgi:hypothetical protein